MGPVSNRKAKKSFSKITVHKFPTETKKEDSRNIQTVIKPKVGILNYFDSRSRGNREISNATKLKKTVIMNRVNKFKFDHALNSFEKRISSIAWNPKYSHIFVAGSMSGEVTLHSRKNCSDSIFPHISTGGPILALKFNADNPYTVYAASTVGIRERDFLRKKSKILSCPMPLENSFTCFDIDFKRNIMLAGDRLGYGYLETTTGPSVWLSKRRLHDSKITHCEFNTHDPNIFVTSSMDNLVKLWDLRFLLGKAGKPQHLRTFHHEKAVNSAYFSPSNGLSVLTTDLYDQIRVYSSPFWDETLVIKHPHRLFENEIPIKAAWHPLEDIIIVGRVPHDDFMESDYRSIDFYDGSNGDLLHRIVSPTGKIVSLNAMNISGDTLAAAAANKVVFLKDENNLNGLSCRKGSDDDNTPFEEPNEERVYRRKIPQKSV